MYFQGSLYANSSKNNVVELPSPFELWYGTIQLDMRLVKDV